MSDYWQSNLDAEQCKQVATEVVDVLFKLQGKAVPVDHAWQLSTEILRLAPWFSEEKQSALHLIHVAESGNGWQRPEQGGELLNLSKRTCLTLRIPANRLDDVKQLKGQSITLSGQKIILGPCKVKLLVKSAVLFSRYLKFKQCHDEPLFLAYAESELKKLKIKVNKMLSGKVKSFSTPSGLVYTRSLMLAGLDNQQSIKIQQEGLGDDGDIGCGVFIAHKGIEAVGDLQES
jgi:CRISPR-associated protein Cas6